MIFAVLDITIYLLVKSDFRRRSDIMKNIIFLEKIIMLSII